MIKFKNAEIYGWEDSIIGMRNPLNSWDESHSLSCEKHYDYDTDSCWECMVREHCDAKGNFHIVPNGLKLIRCFLQDGIYHKKFDRMINVNVDITSPLYWWKEFDTYKVGTVANSCSIMHKISAKKFTLDDFSHDHLMQNDGVNYFVWDVHESDATDVLNHVIFALNYYRDAYLETEDKRYWWQMIQLLPYSYNQTRTIQFNYQELWFIYKSCKNPKLEEWNDFCDWADSLPCFKEAFMEGER